MKQTQLKLNGQVGRDLRKDREDRERQKAAQLRDQQNALGVSEDEALRMAIAASMGGDAGVGAGAADARGSSATPAQPVDAATADLELAMAMSASLEGKKAAPKKKDDDGCCIQ